MAGPIRIAILGNGRQARAEAALTARAYGLMGRKVSSVGKLVAGAFAARELVRAGAAVVQVGGQYVGSLNKIQALTNSSNRVMDKAAGRLEKNAGLYAKMGQTTGDAASGVVELTKAGLSLNKSLAAVRATMTLAKAGELSVADASTLVANTLNTFSLKAKDASKIANGLANAANISSADVADLAESFKYVAPIAAKAGVSLDQTNAILAELSNSGVKASQAGTGLRKFLLSLQAPSGAASGAIEDLGLRVYDAQGKMRPLPALIEDMRGKLGKLTQEGQNKALRNIFGLTGITSAQIILKNGADGLKKYTKGVQRAGAAQKLANAASKGFKGTLDSLKSSVVSTTQELYRRFSPKLNKPLQELAHWLSENQGQMIETGIAAGRRLVPAIKDLATAARDVAGDIKDTATPLIHDLLPAFEDAAKLALGAVRAFNDLPGPVKEIGVQAGVAALILPRLTAGVASVTGTITLNIAKLQQWRAEMTYTETRAQNLTAMTGRLTAAAKTAAGIGGMVLLAQSAKRTSGSMKVLEGAAGGALTGFAVGGPWGAAIGGVTGALYGLASATSEAAVETVTAKDNTKAYVDTLDELTGASTRATRARIFDRLMADETTASLVAQAGKAGLASRDVVSAVMGQRGAWKRLNAALAAAQKEYDGLKNQDGHRGRALQDQIYALNNLVPQIKAESSALASSIATTKAKASAVIDWGRALKGVPKKVRAELANANYRLTRAQVDDLAKKYDLLPAQKSTILTALGVAQARSQARRALDAFNRLPRRIQVEIREVGGGETKKRLREIAREYKLTPRQVRTLIAATGAHATVKQIGAVRRAMDNVNKAKAAPNGWLHGLTAAATRGSQAAKRGGDAVRKGLEKGPHDAKANLSTLIGGIQTGATRAIGVGTRGGHRVGAALSTGIAAGVSSSPIVTALVGAVSVGIAAAKARAKIHSPSRVMRDEVGAMLGKGLVQGVLAWKGKAATAGRSLVDRLTKGAKGGLDGIRSSLQRIDDLINKKLDGKKQAAHRKALLKSLRDERAALIANGKAQDRNSALLEKARQRLHRLTQQARDYAKGIKDGFVSYGSVVGLGTTGDSTAVSLPSMLSQLAARAESATKFSALVKKLRKLKLNKTSLQQLLAQAASGDIDGALASAQAIASGGAGGVAQINALTAQIAKAGADLGQKMKNEFFGAGLKAAQGLVDGLRKKQKDLDRIAERLAQALVNKVKKALGIHSPSRVFRDIGLQTVKGLAIGIDDTYATRAGSRLAGSLQKGFGQPALAAYLGSGSGAAAAGNTYNINVSVPVGASPVQAGREIVKLIDAYEQAGGRRKR